MPNSNTQLRRQQIEAAALEVLSEKGYAGTSMLAIAKRAKASNETLYKWYGDKTGLIASIIEKHMDGVCQTLPKTTDEQGASLKSLGPAICNSFMSDRLLLLQDCAAADPSGQLGRTLSAAARKTIAPLVGQHLLKARESGLIAFGTTAEAVALYFDLLLGDRLKLGPKAVTATSHAATVAARSDAAYKRFLVLLDPNTYPGWHPKYRAKR